MNLSWVRILQTNTEKQQQLWQGKGGQPTDVKSLQSTGLKQGRQGTENPKGKAGRGGPEWGTVGRKCPWPDSTLTVNSSANLTPLGLRALSTLEFQSLGLTIQHPSWMAEMLKQVCARQDQTEDKPQPPKKWKQVRGGEKKQRTKIWLRSVYKKLTQNSVFVETFLVWWQKPNWKHVKYINIIYNFKNTCKD